MTKNAELAYDMKDLIDKHREALNMGVWGAVLVEDDPLYRNPSPGLDRYVSISLADLTADACDTVACLGGWTAAAAGYTVRSNWAFHPSTGDEGYVPVIAAQLLCLNNSDADLLFFRTSNDELDARLEEVFGPDPRPGR